MSQAISASNPSAVDSSAIKRPTFILVDGHSLAFRSYFAYAKGRDGGLRTTTGIPTSVCFGFLKSLLEVMASEQPQAMAIAFDLGLPTFRHEADDTYKADRPGTPEDFVPDLKNLHELLLGFNLPILTAPGYEADDVLGTLAQRASAAGYKVKILTGDRDLFQLIDPQKEISVLYLSSAFIQRGSTGPTEFGPEQVKEKLGVLPSQVVDYKALCGDKSDNIPGVKGIGEKTAVQLLNTYGTLDNIYASLDQIKGAIQKKLEADKEAAYHSRYMAQLVIEVPLEIDLEDCELKGFDRTALEPILEKLEFKSFLGKINQLQQRFGGVAEEDSSQAESSKDGAAMADAIASSNTIQEPEFDSDDLWFFSAADTEATQQQTQAPITPRIIDTSAKLTELVKQLQACTHPATPVAWDTETTALEPRDAQLVGIGCCWGDSAEVAYIPLGHTAGGNLDTATVLDTLRPILESADYPKALQNAKFDRLVLHAQGIKLAGVVFDTMLASYILNPDSSHNLGELALRYLGLNAKSYTDLVPKGQTIADLDIPTVADYCGMDVYATFGLVLKLRTELEKASEKLYQLLLEVELPLEPVLAKMEYDGIRIDQSYLKELSKQLEQYLATIEQQAYAEAGEKFNLGSPKKLSELLFDKLNLDRKKSRKIQTGYSTDAATLEKLQGDHPVVDAILEYRTLSKLKSTYVDALPILVRPDTQRIHTNFNQTGTSTGRLSSSNPNLQNIPIRTAFSRQIRKAFLPEPGWLLVAADYSQIELRILAHLSQEPVLVEAYRENEDIHTVTARLLLEKETVTPDERRLAKTINFGVIYGMGAQRFARETGIKASDAKVFIERFNERYPQVFAYLQQMQQEAIALGYVETILGRRRYFNFTSDRLRQQRNRKPAEINLDELRGLTANDAGLLRAAANAPIQGSSADIIKIAMVRLHEVLQNYQARLLLQVHDELVFEVPPDEWEELQPQIRSTMESAVELTVPLVVDVRAGQNWMETK